LAGRSQDRLEASAEIGSGVRGVQADVQNEASVEAALLKLDSLITYLFQPKMPRRTLSETTKDKFRPTLDSKIWGALHVVKHALLT